MSQPDAGAPREEAEGRPQARGPGVADLGAFRGRTTRFGAPVLPPAYRPGVDDLGLDTVRVDVVPAPVARPAPAPRPADPVAPEAAVVPARTVGAEVRVVRRLRPWSVWKLSLTFSLCLVGVFATAGLVLWAVAAALGVLGNIEGLVEDLGFDNFSFDGSALLTAFVVGGLLGSMALSLMAAILTVMFNVLSDLTGGLETETAPKRRKARTLRRQARKAARAERAATRKAAKKAEKARARRPRRWRRRKPVEPAEVAAGLSPTTSEIPARNGEAVAVAAVEVARRKGEPDLDLTEDGCAVEEVDHIQRALDDLLAESAPPPPDPDRPD